MDSDAHTYSMNKNIIQENITTCIGPEMFLFCTLWTWASVPCEFCSKLLVKDALLHGWMDVALLVSSYQTPLDGKQNLPVDGQH